MSADRERKGSGKCVRSSSVVLDNSSSLVVVSLYLRELSSYAMVGDLELLMVDSTETLPQMLALSASQGCNAEVV